jgi:hypothetical protein
MTRQDFIINTVADFYGVNPTDILGKSRRPEIVRARFVSMAFMHKDKMVQTQIGRYFNRDHSSVHHAMKQLNESAMPGVQKEILQISAVLGKPKPTNHLLIADGVSVAYEHNQDSFGLYNMTVTIFE